MLQNSTECRGIDGAFNANADFPFDVTPPPTGAPGTPCRISLGRESQEPAPSDSAGDIVIDIPASSGATSSTLSFDRATKRYEPITITGVKGEVLPKGDAPIHVHARGASVPAFDVTVPAAFEMSILEPAEGAVLSKSSGDLLVRWTDGGNDYVFTSLTIADATVSCTFPASARQGAIPAALVTQAFESSNAKGCAGKCVSLFVTALRSTRVKAGDIDVSVTHTVAVLRDLQAE